MMCDRLTRLNSATVQKASILIIQVMVSTVHLISFALPVLAFAWFVAAKNCENLTGTWYNQRGGQLYLEQGSDGRLLGEYKTAEERLNSAGQVAHSIVLGTAPYDNPEGTFAFSLVWGNGTSTTVWTAQCLVCEAGRETLFTSWLQRTKVDKRADKFKSTTIGQDTFTRYEQPMKPNESSSEAPPSVRAVIKNWDPDVKNKPCSLNGYWYNQLGSETILNQKNDSVVEGEYRTAVERKPGTAGKSFSKVLGIGQVGGPSSTFPFMVVWRNGGSVTGWLGQCFVYGENKTEIVETAWLLRVKIDKCIDNWKSTLYGQDTFTHTEQKAGPRKKDGTDVPDRPKETTKKPKVSAGCQLLFPFALLELILLHSLLGWLN